MGYTHYWTPAKKCGPKWKEFCDRFQKMVPHCGATICNGLGEPSTKPIIESNYLAFNGDADYDEDHETAGFERNGEWSFCKTAYKPYDTLVVATLMLGYELGVIKEWSSDGEAEDHKAGLELYEKHSK